MAEPSETGEYVRLSDVKAWWDGEAMHLTINDPDLSGLSGKDGFRVRFNANPKSADYNPANLNRLAAVLRKHGKSAPESKVEERPRRLDKR